MSTSGIYVGFAEGRAPAPADTRPACPLARDAPDGERPAAGDARPRRVPFAADERADADLAWAYAVGDL